MRPQANRLVCTPNESPRSHFVGTDTSGGCGLRGRRPGYKTLGERVQDVVQSVSIPELDTKSCAGSCELIIAAIATWTRHACASVQALAFMSLSTVPHLRCQLRHRQRGTGGLADFDGILARAEYGESILEDRSIAFQVSNELAPYVNHGHHPHWQGSGPANYSNGFSAVDTARCADPQVAIVDHKLLGRVIPDLPQSLQALSSQTTTALSSSVEQTRAWSTLRPSLRHISCTRVGPGDRTEQPELRGQHVDVRHDGNQPSVVWWLPWCQRHGAMGDWTTRCNWRTATSPTPCCLQPLDADADDRLGRTVGPIYYAIFAAAEVFGTSNKTHIADRKLARDAFGNRGLTVPHKLYQELVSLFFFAYEHVAEVLFRR
uniref:Uncharacterized protein n=1 Tax=Mycena chlorophos TaxID=658473 RepID=A0ABQ0LYC7_MYCCL|nr:predicted protein [Mycena chlorophos]